MGKLMHDFRCTRAEDMYYPALAERVRYLKEHEEGKDFMSGVLEEWREAIIQETKAEAEKALQAEREAAEKAAAEEKSRIARRVLKNHKLNEEEVDTVFRSDAGGGQKAIRAGTRVEVVEDTNGNEWPRKRPASETKPGRRGRKEKIQRQTSDRQRQLPEEFRSQATVRQKEKDRKRGYGFSA